MANAFVVHSLAMPLVSANFYLTAVWTMDWVLSHSRLTPTDDWCLHQGVYMEMGTSWLNPTWLFGLQECWSARPSLWVCACLQTELLCVSFEIPHTGDTTWSLSSSVRISSLCVWGSPGPGRLLLTTWFHRLLQLSILCFFARATSCLCIHLSMAITMASKSWLL